MKNKISFSDLQHTNHPCNAFPLGIGLVASWAMKNIGDEIEVDVFRQPDDFSEYLDRGSPKIACFSNYIWNINLNYQFARRIKKLWPDMVIVFGGPNYPLDAEEQAIFLQRYSDIDFHVFRDGEQCFVELYQALSRFNFSAPKLKNTRSQIPGCHYLCDGELILGDQLPRVTDLDEIPSPYLSGMFEKFFENDDLMPLMLTARGCPFKCTFCQEGDEYFNRMNRYSIDRVKEELHYIAARSKNPSLMFADSNFGMYKYDAEIAQEIVSILEKYGWPKYFSGVNGKNNKARVLEVASIIQSGASDGGSVFLSAAVQSTDEEVLKSVKRDNISTDAYLHLVEKAKADGSNTFSELILGLPGDSKASHIKSVSELVDVGINVIRSHQFLMLQGSETSTRESLEQHGMLTTRFRVMTGTVNPYRLFGETFVVSEVDELCVGNNTMSFDDYLECRMFDLTIEIFYNNGLFQELINFLKFHQILISSFIFRIHRHIHNKSTPLSPVYEGFLEENLEVWEDREDLERFLEEPGVLDRYMSGELGNNEQLVFRALAVFKHMSDLHNIAFGIAREMLDEKACYDKTRNYLDELARFSLLRKRDVLSTEEIETETFHYDFVSLEAGGFAGDPSSFRRPEGTRIKFFYGDSKKERISSYIDIYGRSNVGLGTILREGSLNGSDIDIFYRTIQSLDPIGVS